MVSTVDGVARRTTKSAGRCPTRWKALEPLAVQPSGKGTRDMKLTADSNATTYRELQALPTDTDDLYEWIWNVTEGQGPSHAQAALEKIGSMLESATLLPEVEAALYRVAAQIPGVSVVEDAKDAAGRAPVSAWPSARARSAACGCSGQRPWRISARTR